jgi:hypothetical protein
MKKNLLFASMAVAFAGLFTSCTFENGDNPAPAPPTTDERIETVIPSDIRATIEVHIPIYDGVTPPNVEGTYFLDPQILKASSLTSDSPGKSFMSEYDRFYDQNTANNTINMLRVQGGGSEWALGKGAFISGYGDNFTIYFDMEGENGGATFKEAYILSGTKTSVGISNLVAGFILKEKNDPNNILVEVGTFRFFTDSDGMSEKTEWPYEWPYTGPSAKTRGTDGILPCWHTFD